MKDFTKWEAMWDAYNRMGEAVSGSPASICQGIGVTLMMVFGFVGLIAVAVIGGMGGDPEKSPFFRLTTAIAVIGGVLALASFVLPSHNDAHVSEPPTLSEQIEGAWNLGELDDCENMGHVLTNSPKLPKSSLEDGDWKCVAYADNQRTEVTVHIKGDKAGLHDEILADMVIAAKEGMEYTAEDLSRRLEGIDLHGLTAARILSNL